MIFMIYVVFEIFNFIRIMDWGLKWVHMAVWIYLGSYSDGKELYGSESFLSPSEGTPTNVILKTEPRTPSN